MDDSGPWLRRWRIALGLFGAVLLLSTLGALYRDIAFDWASFGLASVNLSAAYVGFGNRPRFVVKLAVVWTALDLLVVAWTTVVFFLRTAISTGSWDFQSIH
jgi:hypothetical protein